MTFTTYFYGRFLRHFFAINICLTALFVCIEFFEKMMRTTDVSVAHILYFLCLSIIPSFFSYLPVAAWLATCFLIREMNTHNEWDTLSMLGVSKQHIAKHFATIAAILMCMSFVGKEIIVTPLAQHVESYKTRTFKHASTHKLYNKWFMLDAHHIYTFGMIDRIQQEAHNVLVIELDEHFATKKMTSASRALLDTQSKQLTLIDASTLSPNTVQQNKIPTKRIHVPQLFAQLSLSKTIPSFGMLSLQLFGNKKMFSAPLFKTLLADWLGKILWHLQVLFYPILTYLIFCLSSLSLKTRWLLMLSPYPFTVLSCALATYLVQQGLPVWVLTLPYFVLFTAIIALFFKI